MQFRLLGPVEIENAGQVLPLPRRRERCLLAVLLLSPNQVVSAGRLADLLWDDEPPERARRMIRSHISRLRGLLVNGDAVAIEWVGDGYRISLDPHTIDAHRFHTLVAQAATTVDPAERIGQLRTALDLWRGPPLDNAANDRLRDRLCTQLKEQHLAAAEDLFSASLELRRERSVLPELAQLAGAHPGREGLIALHMRALYQADRKADALAIHEHARTFLADELGLDPSPALRELHRAILRDELAVPIKPAVPDSPPRSPDASQATFAGHPPRAGRVVPRHLPADVSGFTGRGTQLGAC